jgi:hypothetical protein
LSAPAARPLPLLGWREWVSLPALALERIKAKVDTGARTSCLHAFRVRGFRRAGDLWVRFGMHPDQGSSKRIVECEARVIDRRAVTDSGGHTQNRYVIESEIVAGEYAWMAEITLTNRDTMRFRMLIGRTALNGRFLVDPARSYLAGGSSPETEQAKAADREEIEL